MQPMSETQQKSLWERVVEWTIAVGERILVPVERFIGKRSLVGDATFFPLERFPWVKHIEDNWMVIREEAEALLEDQGDLVAIAQFAMHTREHVVMLRSARKGILAHTMFYASEVRAEEERVDLERELCRLDVRIDMTFLLRQRNRFLDRVDPAIHDPGDRIAYRPGTAVGCRVEGA